MGKVCNVYFLSTDIVTVILKIKVLKICSLPSNLKCKLLHLQKLWYYILLCLDKNDPTTINNYLAVCLICLAIFFSRNIFAAFEKLYRVSIIHSRFLYSCSPVVQDMSNVLFSFYCYIKFLKSVSNFSRLFFMNISQCARQHENVIVLLFLLPASVVSSCFFVLT